MLPLCCVFKLEVIASRGDISIHLYAGGASQITISHRAANKQPTQIHSHTLIRPALCSHNLQDPTVSNLISI